MRIRFWGVRGSIPTPSRETFSTVKYGGNTPCVEIRTKDDNIIVADAGTGLRLLGNELMGLNFEGKTIVENTSFSQGKGKIYILISHVHWDHIQGIPFFKPLFVEGNVINFVGSEHLNKLLPQQMRRPFFPVDYKKTPSTKKYIKFKENGGEYKVGNTLIMARTLNHTDLNFGYRIDDGERIITYASDMEHSESDEKNGVAELARDADLLIYDCHYTFLEYEPELHGKMGSGKKLWGHSIIQEGIKLAAKVRAKKLVSFHHNPESSDQKIDDILRFANDFKKDYNPHLEIIAAYEGLEIIL